MSDFGSAGCPPERLGERRFVVEGDEQRGGAERSSAGMFGVAVLVRDIGAPGVQVRWRRRDVDAGLSGGGPCLVGRPGIGMGGHGAVDGVPAGLFHPWHERCRDEFLAGGEDEFQLGAVLDVDTNRPVRTADGGFMRQAGLDRVAVKVDDGLVVGAAAVREDADPDAFPRIPGGLRRGGSPCGEEARREAVNRGARRG